MKKLSIVIPCYNEENRFPLKDYHEFIEKNPGLQFCFVNDGSSDGTLEILKQLHHTFPINIGLLTYSKNMGKAEAIRKGIHYCNKHYDHSFIGFLDADLSTSLSECLSMSSSLTNGVVFVFGSRIMKIGSTIIRNRFRFITGRILATFISSILRLKVYDTQCGCKLFTRQASEIAFETPFVSSWLFDVEIFQRFINHYGKILVLEKMLEVPLKRWIDRGDSKVKPSYFFRLWYDLYKISNSYRGQKKIVLNRYNTIPEDVQV
ncbi:MAG: glycosyltransferase [Eudoraea sp.]|nr:glycosyltransferase [Eudoraea sp.]